MPKLFPEWIKRLVSARQQGWIGCIDFGTAFSKVAMVASESREDLQPSHIRPLPIGRNISLNPFLLPSIIFVTDDVITFAGEAERAALRMQQSGREAFSSPKQYLSTHDPEDLDDRLPTAIDPTSSYSARDLLSLYLAFLLRRAEEAAREQRLPWPPKLRIARPAWKDERADWGEETLRKLIKDAFVLVDFLGEKLSKPAGIAHPDARAALQQVSQAPEVADTDVFALSASGQATVLEATAVAAGSIRPTGRRIVVVADIGGGTSDFAAFMTGLAGRNVVAELRGSAEVLREAGDHLDMLLRGYILRCAGLLPDDAAARGPSNRIRSRQRTLKEELFSQHRISVEVNDEFIEISLSEFLEQERVVEFSRRLREKFLVALDVAIQCASAFSSQRRVPIEIMPTGGGHALPMVQDLVSGCGRDWTFVPASPDLMQSTDADFAAAIRQLTVSIGGAVKDLPAQTAPVTI